jgi:polyisoprenoid-binding protein YceI
MKHIALFVTVIALTQMASAQVFMTRTGKVSFFSHTAVEDIKAENNEVLSFFDAGKGELRYQVLIKSFRFPKASMEQHFNQPTYMDSDKFPKSEFKGTLADTKAVNVNKDGTYKVTVNGELTMHGVTQKVSVPGTITIKGGKVSASAVFTVKRSDYGVTVPSFSAAKIADEIEVTLSCDYEPYKQ